MKNWTEKRPWLLLGLLNLLLMLFLCQPFIFSINAEQIWATSDDIYISACFARNLAKGDGLVWYPNAPKVEGFSNPLWVMLLAIFHIFPFFTESHLGFYLFLLNSLILFFMYMVFWKILCRISSQWNDSLFMRKFILSKYWYIIILSFTFVSLPYWMAEGFSIGLITLLYLIVFYLTITKKNNQRKALMTGMLIGIAFWVRMDGIIYFIGIFLLTILMEKINLRYILVQASVIFLMIMSLFFARWIYYGMFFPNTYYLKLQGWAKDITMSIPIK